MLSPVTHRDDALSNLAESGIAAALEWAAPVAFEMTAEDYDEERGHDQVIVGLHNFVYLRDLLDRVTSNGRFSLAVDATSAGEDMIRRGISPAALAAMPHIRVGAIARSDYQQSPGWSAAGYRVLLQSYKFGGIDHIKWAQRSDAKRLVAAQQFIGAPTLFDDSDYGIESLPGVPKDQGYSGITLVAAHAYDTVTGDYEMFVGQSKNPEFRGDSCWHWKHRLLRGGSNGAASFGAVPALPGLAASPSAEEVRVQLRKPRSRANG